MTISSVIVSQYLAALEMLKHSIARCPADMWDDPTDTAPFWHVAYHALYYTHLYLQDSRDSFTPWPKSRPNDHSLQAPAQGQPRPQPYDKDTVLEYLAFCRQQAVQRVPTLDMDAPSGFYWLRFSKLELQIYNIRHIQQHSGELMERLGARFGIDIDWVGALSPAAVGEAQPGLPPAAAADLPPGIGAPARRALAAAGITTLQQVAQVSEADLLAMHGVGPKALRILRAALQAQGMDFAPAPAPSPG